MAKRLAPDFPQELLDLFSDVDWSRVPKKLRTWAARIVNDYVFGTLRLPRKTAPATGSVEHLRVTEDVPQELLDIGNAVDWSRVPKAQITGGIDQLRALVKKVPQLDFKRTA